MSDELSFLRWFYRNHHRFMRTNAAKLAVEVDVDVLIDAYRTETGNKVPADYVPVKIGAY